MTVYAKSARFDTGHPLSENELRELAPSIFANTAHHSRSERFAPIPTIEVLRHLAAEGFHAYGAQETKARDASKQSHTKHLIRLRRDDGAKYKVGDTVCEILLKNANDGSSVYELMGGLFRIACMNSLVAMQQALENIRIRHSGNVAHQVIEGTYEVLERAELALAAPQDWSKINLDANTRDAFAEVAHRIRFPADENGNQHTAVTPEQLLIPRRPADTGRDLWTIFNVVQENAIVGGIQGRYTMANGRRGRRTSREVKGIDQSININKRLWTLGETLAAAAA